MTLINVNLSELAQVCRANSEPWFPWAHDSDNPIPLALYWALGLAGEAGEVANEVKKKLRNAPGEPLADALGVEMFDELADVFVYLVLLADECGVDLMEAYQRKAAICEKRWGTTGQWRDAEGVLAGLSDEPPEETIRRTRGRGSRCGD